MVFDPLYPTVHHFDTHFNEDAIMWKLADSQYLRLGELLQLIPERDKLRGVLKDHHERMLNARGSSNNHQAWIGGYLDHVVEVMNIAAQLYETLNYLRTLPFTMSDALLVMFLHDLEKPWKYTNGLDWRKVDTNLTGLDLSSKQGRKNFRNGLIRQYGITLTAEHENALKYVEGVPDSEYTPGERTMGELAAFCHMCDICSARLWHDKGRDQEWE